jgi:hypothetical protein
MNKIQALYFTFRPNATSDYDSAFGLFSDYNSFAEPLFQNSSEIYQEILISKKIESIMIVISGCSIAFRLLLSVKQQHITSLIKDAKDFNDCLFNSPDINTIPTLENKDNGPDNLKDPINDIKQKDVEDNTEDQKQEDRIDSINLSKYGHDIVGAFVKLW